VIDEKVTSKFHSADLSSETFLIILVKKSKMKGIWIICYWN